MSGDGVTDDTAAIQAAIDFVTDAVDSPAPFGPQLATIDDIIAGRARYADTPGGHADRRAGRLSGEMPGRDG